MGFKANDYKRDEFKPEELNPKSFGSIDDQMSQKNLYLNKNRQISLPSISSGGRPSRKGLTLVIANFYNIL